MAAHPFTIATLPEHEAWLTTYRSRGGRFSDVVRTALALVQQDRLSVVEIANPQNGSDSSVRLNDEAVAVLDSIRGVAPRVTFLRAAAAAYMGAFPPEPAGFEPESVVSDETPPDSEPAISQEA